MSGHRMYKPPARHRPESTCRLKRSQLELCRIWVQGVVDLVHNVRGANASAIKFTTVQAFVGPLASGSVTEFDIHIAFCIGISCNVNGRAIRAFHLALDLCIQILNPIGAIVLVLPRYSLAWFVRYV